MEMMIMMGMVMITMLRMQLWLNDPGNMDKLLAIKNGQQQVKLTLLMMVMMMAWMMMRTIFFAVAGLDSMMIIIFI